MNGGDELQIWGETMMNQSYLEDFGAVFEGVRVADVVDQADDVAGQVGIRQVVEVREDFMKLRRKEV